MKAFEDVTIGAADGHAAAWRMSSSISNI